MKLRTQISVYFLGLMLCWFLLLVGVLHFFMSRMSLSFFRDKGTHMVQALATEISPLVHYEDHQSVAERFTRYLESFPDIRYLIVFDSAGDMFASTFQEGLPKDLLSPAADSTRHGDVRVELIRSTADNELIYDYELTRAGIRFRAGLGFASTQALIRKTLLSVAPIGILGIIGVFLVAFHVSRPVEILSAAAERLMNLDIEGEAARRVAGTHETDHLETRFRALIFRLEERNRQLDASKKLAYLGEISTSIAHEVNNPLGVIVMNCGFLLKRAKAGELSSATAEEVRRLHTGAKRATLAVQKLLQFARHSTQEKGIRLVPTQNLRGLIEETVDLLQDRIQGLQCKVVLDVPAQLSPIPCDQHGLQQVLVNLLTNALDVSPEGSQIRIQVVETDREFMISVTDQGTGMTQEILEKAREPFFTTKGVDKGTGLGLTISDSIIHAHYGKLTFESEIGQGTTVTVRLPKKAIKESKS